MASTPNPSPVCKAILLCDQTILEQGTGKLSLIGIFDSFFISGDGETAGAQAFLQITDASGAYSISVEIIDLTDNEIVARSSPSEINIDSPLMRANVIIPIPRLPLRAGSYDFVVLANGDVID